MFYFFVCILLTTFTSINSLNTANLQFGSNNIYRNSLLPYVRILPVPQEPPFTSGINLYLSIYLIYLVFFLYVYKNVVYLFLQF